jgi:uncharacterized membrane protein
MNFAETIEAAGQGMDIAGVGVIILGILLSSGYFLLMLLHRTDAAAAYKRYRQNVGRALLLGLELLVAADIIRTVAVKPTMESVLVLGLIVIIRTFLSWSLEVELEGRWPWQRPKEN